MYVCVTVGPVLGDSGCEHVGVSVGVVLGGSGYVCVC